MDELKKLVLEIMSQGYLISLATTDSGGLWVSDVIYVHDDELTIYWASSSGARHSQAIGQTAQVSGAITITTGPGQPNVGLQIAGVATEAEPSEAVLARYAAKRQKPNGLINLPGHRWYCLKPTLIDVIHEPSWGFHKKTIKL